MNSTTPSPHITQVNPFLTYPGSVIDIVGEGFADTLDGNTVMVGGQPARVIHASTTALKVIVSLDALDGPITVDTGGNTWVSPNDFKAKPYPLPGSGEDGPPAYFEGAQNLLQGDLPSTGTLRALVVLVNPTDVVPSNPTNARNDVNNRWATVHTFYDQASFGTLDVQSDLTTGWNTLLKDRAYYIDDAITNIKQSVLDQLVAEAAQAAVNDGKNLDNYGMMAVVMFLNGAFIRAWGGWSKQNFNYTDAATSTNINITANHQVNLLTIQESADWGRFAHETGHNLVSAPSFQSGTIGTATLGEDVYSSDLVDPNAATAHSFDIMGDHDRHPLFSAYHMDKLGYYSGSNIVDLQWDRNAFSQDIDVVAHGLTKNTVVGRCHLIRIKVANGLYYYVEVRQKPGSTSQVFDDNIPIGSAPNQGGVVVTKVLMDTMNNNQQTRFITLLHDPIVLKQGESAVDPARTLQISVLNNNVVARPLVCRLRVEWAQGIAADPNGAFDLSIDPWNSNYESPDIWLDRPPFGTFDNPKDTQGRPTGNGDKPQPLAINKFTARIENQGTVDTTNVKVIFYTVTPPGVGDNGNWAPLTSLTVAQIAKNSFQDISANWVPVLGQHTCLRVFAGQQLGEITGGNNWAQENVAEFTAPAGSIPEPQIAQVAVRNPREEKSLVYVSLQNVPFGYIVQFPHQWLLMNGLEERTLEMVVIPRLDYTLYENADKEPDDQERQTKRRADVRVVGFVPREYTNELTANQLVGSRMFHIGGILTRVTPKRYSKIELSEDDEYGENHPFLSVVGWVSPAQPDEKTSVFLTSPDSRQWVLETTTDGEGMFRAVFDLTTRPTLGTLRWQLEYGQVPLEPSEEIKPLSGVYNVQAFLVNSPSAAEAESNVVNIRKSF
jgi:M6 family metalloprotease-like protein